MYPWAQARKADSSNALPSETPMLDAFTFDGTPFKVAMPSMKSVGCGATAQIFLGQVLASDRPILVAVKVFGNMMEEPHG